MLQSLPDFSWHPRQPQYLGLPGRSHPERLPMQFFVAQQSLTLTEPLLAVEMELSAPVLAGMLQKLRLVLPLQPGQEVFFPQLAWHSVERPEPVPP